ncbi:MAG: hypothetical protein HYV36_04670, partial [Lentisphaerae bacterium]|nr:hypothetical protein [Lentisphaerota bacterium]
MTPTTQQAADDQAPPELKQVVGGLLFAAHKPVSVAELHEVLTQVDQNEQNARLFSRVQERDIRAAIEQV